MDDIQQLGEMLRHYAASEAHKKQLFDSQSVVWARRIHQLFGQIEDWLAPVLLPDLLALQREPMWPSARRCRWRSRPSRARS